MYVLIILVLGMETFIEMHVPINAMIMVCYHYEDGYISLAFIAYKKKKLLLVFFFFEKER